MSERTFWSNRIVFLSVAIGMFLSRGLICVALFSLISKNSLWLCILGTELSLFALVCGVAQIHAVRFILVAAPCIAAAVLFLLLVHPNRMDSSMFFSSRAGHFLWTIPIQLALVISQWSKLRKYGIEQFEFRSDPSSTPHQSRIRFTLADIMLVLAAFATVMAISRAITPDPGWWIEVIVDISSWVKNGKVLIAIYAFDGFINGIVAIGGFRIAVCNTYVLLRLVVFVYVLYAIESIFGFGLLLYIDATFAPGVFAGINWGIKADTIMPSIIIVCSLKLNQRIGIAGVWSKNSNKQKGL